MQSEPPVSLCRFGRTMPWTADQKRKRRAEQVQVAGKRFKPRKHPFLLEQPPPALDAPPAQDAPSAPSESKLTVEEEMNRARMEVEDCRVRIQSVMQASASLLSFYQVWLAPGQVVKLRPHYARLLQLGGRDAGYRHRLVKRAAMAAGDWL